MPESPVVTVPTATTGLFTWACPVLNCFFMRVCWEQEVASGTDTFEFRPVWGHWVLLLAGWLCGVW